MSLFCGLALSCVRGERRVFADVSFALSAGDALVLVGANGSGKSSLLRLMAGLSRPRSGQVSWADRDIHEDVTGHAGRLTFVGHSDAIKPTLSVRENLVLWAACRRGGRVADAPIERALKTLGIERLADLPARYLSAGQRRRLALARLANGRTPLWLLDEPKTALDVQTQARIDRLIAAHRDQGGIVVLSQHGQEVPSGARVLDLGPFSGLPPC